jgi:hypothetical protein
MYFIWLALLFRNGQYFVRGNCRAKQCNQIILKCKHNQSCFIKHTLESWFTSIPKSVTKINTAGQNTTLFILYY